MNKPSSPDEELSKTDTGDDTQRRFRYQAKYSAWKSISMLDADSEIECLFCEQHQDTLVRLKTGRFSGVQVKTRISSRPPMYANDDEILETLNRFVELDTTFSGMFSGFVIATNHGFLNDNTERSLNYHISRAHGSSNSDPILAKYALKVGKAKNNSVSEKSIRRVLEKLHLEAGLPQFEDFETLIAEQIGKMDEYRLLPLHILKNAASVLINKVLSMSSLEVPRLPEVVFKTDPEAYETEAIITSKRMTPLMVQAAVQSSINPTNMDSPVSATAQAQELQVLSLATIGAIKKSFSQHSRKLMKWPTTLDGSTRIESPALEVLKQNISQGASSVQFLLGPPGAGKSALLAMFANEMSNAHNVVLALKADQPPGTLESEANLQAALDLEFPLHVSVRQLAKSERVVIILDQLDALSDLICLNSQRLLTLLSLIEKLAGTQNVHIVASARQFDAEHDPHIRSIEAQRITLELPSWEQVSPILESKGISYDAWTDDVRMLLCTPQYLKIFLDIQSEEKGSVFQSYRGLLNALWRLRVEDKNGESEELLEQIAARMSKFEELTVPLSAYAKRRETVDRLAAAHILFPDVTGGTLTFTHQTLFEYVRARTFLKGIESLSVYVNDRQNSLFIRPQLWNALNFMRDEDSGQYRSEVSALMKNQLLRFHVRYLLIEFLGQLSEPRDYEMTWILPLLNDDAIDSAVISSLVGSPGWFRKLADNYLPGVMRDAKDKSNDILSLLRAAINFEREKVLSLLEQNWLIDEKKDAYTLSVLDAMSTWCARSLSFACTVLERSDIRLGFVDVLCGKLCDSSPSWAAQLFAAHLRREIWRARNESLNDDSAVNLTPSFSNNDPAFEDFNKDFNFPIRRSLIKLVDRTDFSLLTEIVESDPKAVVETLWPIVSDVLKDIAHRSHEFLEQYPSDGTHANFDADEVSRKNSILTAMDEAMTGFAKASPAEFCAFVEQNKSIEHLTVQRLLARGLLHAAEILPDVSFKFLIEDSRRLRLGPSSAEHQDSSNLITALYPFLASHQQTVVNEQIAKYSRYRIMPQNDPVKTRFERLKWDRQHRLKLIQSIPANLMPKDLTKLRSEEERALPTLPVRHHPSEVSWIGSPITLEQMTLSSVEDLIELFKELNDTTGDTHPKDWMKGGTLQLSRTLKDLAKIDKEKVLKLLKKFEPGINEIAAAHAVRGLEESDLDAELLFQMIIDLDKRGFKSALFRGNVTTAVKHKAECKISIPDEVVDLLGSYLGEYTGGNPEVIATRDRVRDGSILWSNRDPDEGFSETSTFTLVVALVAVFFNRKLADLEAWLKLLESLVDRTDLTDYELTWRLIAGTWLTNLRFVDHTRANKLLESLVTRQHSPLISKCGAFLLANTHGWLKEDLVRMWLEAFLQSSWKCGAGTYGELLCLHHLWFPDRIWAKNAIETAFPERKSGELKPALKGIAYTLGHLWASQGNRALKTELLRAILETQNDECYEAISEGLCLRSFPVDEETRSLLSLLSENRKLLRKIDTYHLVENLQDLVEWYPESIYTLCLAILDEFGTEIADIRTDRVLMSGGLLDLVLRLQHQDEPLKSRGLDLFERLIELRVPDARTMLNALDRRVDVKTVLSQTRSQRIGRNRRRRNS